MPQNIHFNVDALLVFSKVVECRSLSRAADLLGMPKSTVSRKISRLEADLDSKLLRKNTHQISVTDLGEQVYQHSLKILSEANDIRSLVEGSKQEPQGALRVAMPVFVGIDYAASVSSRFLQRSQNLNDSSLPSANGRPRLHRRSCRHTHFGRLVRLASRNGRREAHGVRRPGGLADQAERTGPVRTKCAARGPGVSKVCAPARDARHTRISHQSQTSPDPPTWHDPCLVAVLSQTTRGAGRAPSPEY